MIRFPKEKIHNSYIIETTNYKSVKNLIKEFAISNGFDKELVQSEMHPDILYLESETANFKIEDVKSYILDSVYTTPLVNDRKFFIIYDAANLNERIENAMLKSIEEPPEYVTFFLVTVNSQKLLDTIKSRCIILKDNDTINYDELALLPFSQDAIKILGNIKYESDYNIMRFAGNFYKNDENFVLFITLFRVVLKDALCYKKTISKELIGFKQKTEEIVSIANSLSYEDLGKYIDRLDILSNMKGLIINKKIAIYNYFRGE